MTIIATALALLVLLLFLAHSASESTERAAAEEFRRQGLMLAKEASDSIEFYVQMLTKALRPLTRSQSVLSNTPGEIRHLLDLKAQELKDSGVRDVGLIDSEGVLRFSAMHPQIEGADFSRREYFQRARGVAPDGLEAIIDFVDVDGVDPPGALFVGVPIARPLPGGQGKEFAGIIACVVDFRFVAARFVEPIQQSPRGHAFLLDGKGTVLSAPVRSTVGSHVLTGCGDLEAFRQVVGEMTRGKTGTGEYKHYARNEETGEYGDDLEAILIAFAPVEIGKSHWSIGVWSPKADALSDIRSARNLQHLVVGFSTLIILAGATGALTICAKLRGMLRKEVNLKTVELREKQEQIESSNRELAAATSKVSELIETAARELVLGNYFENPNLVTCWQERGCTNTWCPVHGKTGLRCWQTEGTFCDNDRAETFAEKVTKCRVCDVYKQSCPDRLTELAEGFNTMMHLLRHKVEEMRQLRYRALQRERMATIGQMAAGIAHEIDNPIASLFSLVQLLRESGLDDENLSRLSLMQQCIERISKTVREVVDFGRPVGEDDWTEVDVVKCLEDAVRLLCYDRRARNVAVAMDFEPDLPTTRAVKHQLQQVFMNILVNALDAMHGRGRLSVGGRRVGDTLEFTITDTGDGMEPEQILHIFEPFYTTKAGQKGTGLGLALSMSSIQRHGGAIHVESEVGKGSTFVITIPIRSTDGDGGASRQDPGH